MKSKFEYALNFLKYNLKKFRCPICFGDLVINNRSIVCKNNHLYDITKKGTVSLIDTSYYKQSNIYNKNLFVHRREFIKNNYYKDIYNFVATWLNENVDKIEPKNILDIGCGEAIHSIRILELLDFNYNYFGFDYSKDAINLASDYNSENRFFFVGDLTNIPIKNESIDIILDFLSPYNEKEINRLIKKGSIFIKITPGSEYLKEFRESENIGEYSNESLVENNIKANFTNYKKFNIKNVYSLKENDMDNLRNMTPIRNKTAKNNFDKITIDLNIYIIKGVQK